MSDIVNWDFLAKQLNNFNKNAATEIINPNDRAYFDQQKNEISTNSEPSIDIAPDQSENRETKIVREILDKDSGGEEINYVEIENFKGKMKKINPNDYSVEILANNNRVFLNNLSRIAAGMYTKLVSSHGTKKTLTCIMKDYIKYPDIFAEHKLNFIQAKMIISSLKKTLGHIPRNSISEILSKVDDSSKLLVSEWLKKI